MANGDTGHVQRINRPDELLRLGTDLVRRIAFGFQEVARRRIRLGSVGRVFVGTSCDVHLASFRSHDRFFFLSRTIRPDLSSRCHDENDRNLRHVQSNDQRSISNSRSASVLRSQSAVRAADRDQSFRAFQQVARQPSFGKVAQSRARTTVADRQDQREQSTAESTHVAQSHVQTVSHLLSVTSVRSCAIIVSYLSRINIARRQLATSEQRTERALPCQQHQRRHETLCHFTRVFLKVFDDDEGHSLLLVVACGTFVSQAPCSSLANDTCRDNC
jgi:hypothetical protein